MKIILSLLSLARGSRVRCGYKLSQATVSGSGYLSGEPRDGAVGSQSGDDDDDDGVDNDDGDGDGDGDGDCNDSDGGYLSGEPRDGAIRCKMQFIAFSRICSTGSYCSLSWHIKQQISNQMTKNLHPGQVRVS